MEKFLGLCCCLVGAFIIAAFSLLVFVLVRKGMKSSWSGKVVKKVHNKNYEDQDIYSLEIKTDEGKILKVGVSAQEFSGYKIGNKLIKKSGNLKPFKD